MDDNNAGSFVGVLVVGGIVMVILAIALGRYPGKLAAKRNHPNQAAIMMLGQLGILSFGILWFVALVWAQSNFTTAGMVQGDFRPCPACKELITAKAISCKHCGAVLSAGGPATGYAQPAYNAAPPPAAPAVASVADELAKLAKLRDQGILTQDEFDARKKTVLGG